MLRLAVDLEETTRKLFSTLSMQLVRWFSQVWFLGGGGRKGIRGFRLLKGGKDYALGNSTLYIFAQSPLTLSYLMECGEILILNFTQARTENPDTIALLDCLGDGAAAEEGGPLREMCAKGIVEFLRYAIKQSSKRQQASFKTA